MTSSRDGSLNFDEGWYLKSYPDVGRAIQEGRLGSAREHYLQFGVTEGRLPVEPQPHNGRVFAYGSFGSNNVGDEAILDGIRKLYPRCHQLYHNKMRNGEGSYPQAALNDPGFFRAGDHLIIGGGGLLYDRPTVSLMADLAQAVTAKGGVADIQRLGCEAAAPEYHDEIRRLFSLARHATVRSTESQGIIEAITGIRCPVEFDFAFNLRPDVQKIPRRLFAKPTIGLVTASVDPGTLESIARFIGQNTRNGDNDASRPRFVHLPHSRSYFNLQNNDCIIAETIWTTAGMHRSWSDDAFELWPYRGEPLDTLAAYKRLDGVISFRYHGLIFGKLSEIPTLAVGANQLKVGSFLADHASPLMLGASYADLEQATALGAPYRQFLDLVKKTRAARLTP